MSTLCAGISAVAVSRNKKPLSARSAVFFIQLGLPLMTGSVRQVINKQLQHWKSAGILDKKRNQQIINDLEALKKAAYDSDNLTNAPLSDDE